MVVVGVAHVFIHLVLLSTVCVSVSDTRAREASEKQLPIAGALENAIAPASCPPHFPLLSLGDDCQFSQRLPSGVNSGVDRITRFSSGQRVQWTTLSDISFIGESFRS